MWFAACGLTAGVMITGIQPVVATDTDGLPPQPRALVFAPVEASLCMKKTDDILCVREINDDKY